VAKWLKVAKEVRHAESPAPLELEVTSGTAHQEMREFRVDPGNVLAGKTLAEIGFPRGVLVTMLRRNGLFIPPGGDTRIETGDGMLIMAEINLLQKVEKKYFSQEQP
jgi:cell volume regulation protein A